ncbi:arylsulfotransferase family protein [uncultured Kocuria sp.]|uniref:arylsulfotransferase family protein n=1 Tax=uncultured Kocuria sp. TaxID=259305 RepID=UPI0026173900|nr:arylsulfotransferase family protein [uncultured Kocuria sp.]
MTLLVLSGCSAPGGSTGGTADSPSASPTDEPVAQSPVFDGAYDDYRTRPDLEEFGAEISPGPAAEEAYDGVVVLSPRNTEADEQSIANAVLDENGDPLWLQGFDDIDDAHDTVHNALVQTYEDEPVLTWWEGSSEGGYGYGEVVLVDSSYQEIRRVSAAGGLAADGPDFHEFRITDEDTMLWVAYVPTRTDLREIGGPQDGWVMDGVVQEVDIASGDVLFEWSALDHVPVSATREVSVVNQEWDDALGTEENPLDYFHINSVSVDDVGSLLVSARNTHAVYNIDVETGDVNWTLGGADSDFELSEDAVFAWQHDAQRDQDGTIRLFDNAATPASRENSRVLWLDLDEDAGTAGIARQLDPPEPRLSDYMANASRLDNGNLLVGWGWEHFYTEYTPDGEVVYDAATAPFDSYRAYAAPWTGTPAEPPALVVDGDGAYVSWNGATEVAQWRLLAGADEAGATEHAVVDKDGFETRIPAPPAAPYFAVEALDASGEVLGASFVRTD